MYVAMARALQARIDSGELQPGVRLPSESELAAEFAVNRLTVRQAVAELDRAGSIVIRRGVGTFVREPTVRTTIGVNAETQQSMVGQRPMALPVSGWSGADEQVLARVEGADSMLDRHAGDHLRRAASELVRIDSLASIEGRTWSVNSYWLPKSLVSADFRPPQTRGNVVVSVAEMLGFELWADWREFSAVGADLYDAEHLGVPTGSPLLVREGVSSGPDGTPVLYTRRRIKGDSASFVLNFPRPSSGRPGDDARP